MGTAFEDLLEDWFCPVCGAKNVKKLCDSPR
ncbi:rubredoxin [Nostocaceae cyanobacterium CENA357]|uniref:Rubredoxin n=1 Tax=Atlanticothrix silvestris CENA357 TaxID=1725252 RepID=A0A8J7L3H0_9CYAN|nr:rubredoxin [Atlanticothrix silvestris CENA357]